MGNLDQIQKSLGSFTLTERSDFTATYYLILFLPALILFLAFRSSEKEINKEKETKERKVKQK